MDGGNLKNMKSRVNAFYLRNRNETNQAPADVMPSDLVFADDWSQKTFSEAKKLRVAIESESIDRLTILSIEDLDSEFGSIEEFFLFIKYLAQHKVTLVSVLDELDSSKSAAQFISHAINVWNSKVDRIRADRIKLGMIESKKRGTKLGRRESYNKKDIYNLRDKGLSLSKIADMLGTSKRTVLNYLKKREVALGVKND